MDADRPGKKRPRPRPSGGAQSTEAAPCPKCKRLTRSTAKACLYCGFIFKGPLDPRQISASEVQANVAEFSGLQDAEVAARELQKEEHKRKAWMWNVVLYLFRPLRWLSLIAAASAWLSWFQTRYSPGGSLALAIILTLVGFFLGAITSLCKAQYEGTEEE